MLGGVGSGDGFPRQDIDQERVGCHYSVITQRARTRGAARRAGRVAGPRVVMPGQWGARSALSQGPGARDCGGVDARWSRRRFDPARSWLAAFSLGVDPGAGLQLPTVMADYSTRGKIIVRSYTLAGVSYVRLDTSAIRAVSIRSHQSGPARSHPALGGAASALGMTLSDMRSAYQSGMSISSMASSKGMSQDALVAAMASAIQHASPSFSADQARQVATAIATRTPGTGSTRASAS